MIDAKSDLTDNAIQALQPELDRTAKMIPDEIKNVIVRPLRVRFERMSGELHVPTCAKDVVEQRKADASKQEASESFNAKSRNSDAYGFVRHFWPAKSSLIHLHKDFARILTQDESRAETFACGHKNMKRLARATLLHEIAHLYDFKKKASSEKQYQKLLHFAKKRGIISWVVFGGLIPDHLGTKNVLAQNSPDAYEFKNLKESFAVNLEFFLLDPHYACRKPALYAYFSRLFGAPFKEPGCRVNTRVALDRGLMGHRVIDLNPDRIYQIHYLYASEGEQMVSRWGHAMFRVIGCDPGRQVPGPDCLIDYNDHYVLSFRANVDDIIVSNLKGIMGGYPSELFILPFSQVHSDYTKSELRDLISLPLHLSEDEKREFIYSALESYWSYLGGYGFLTNNCSIESAGLLEGILRNPGDMNLGSMTPRKLYRNLAKKKLIDTSILEAPVRAEAQGVLFRSKRSDIERAFSNVKSFFPAFKNYESFIASSTAGQRRSGYAAIDFSRSNRKKIASSLYLLEGLIQLRAEVVLKQKFAKDFEKARAHEKRTEGQTASVYDKFQKLVLNTSYPWSALNYDYGVPLEEEAKIEEKPVALSEADQQTILELTRAFESRFKTDQDLIKAIVDNRNHFKSEITK